MQLHVPRIIAFVSLVITSACSASTGFPKLSSPTVTVSPKVTISETPTTALAVPPGFRVDVVYDQLELPTSIATDGTNFYVSELKTGRVLQLRDTNGDGTLDRTSVFASDFNAPRGLAFRRETGELYVSSRGRVDALRDVTGDGVAQEKRSIVSGLVDIDISHSNNGIAFGPDGALYITDGAPRLQDLEPNGDTFLYQEKPLAPYAGTILRANPDGKDLKVFARGFRNPFDLAFDADGKLYATDNGEDTLPGDVQGDELNWIEQGADYGYPKILGTPPPGSDTRTPLINFPAHSSPDGIVVYQGTQFPEPYRNQIYIALYGVGRKIVRAYFDASVGRWTYQDFVTNMDRPIDLVQGADGALYILDMNSGDRRRVADPEKPAVIYRVSAVNTK